MLMIAQSSRALSQQTYPVILCLILATSLAVALALPPSWDVAWRLEIAKRILNDAVLYRDIIEVNPPLWFWSALPATLIAKVVGIPPFVALCIGIHLAAITAMWLFDRCLALFVAPNQRMWLVGSALAAILVIPIGDIGQREAPVLVAGLLWSALLIARVKGVNVPIWLVAGITLFAAYGFALKHYYLVIPIGLEIWVAITLKSAWRPLRLENLLLGCAGIIYGVLVLTLAPNFLSDIVPLVALSYDGVIGLSLAPPWKHSLTMLLLTLLIILPFYLARSVISINTVAQALFITLGLHVVAIFLQGKGFANHFLAAKGAAVVLWAFICSQTSNNEIKLTINPRIVLSLLIVGWIGIPAAMITSQMLNDHAPSTSNNNTLAMAASPTDAVVQAVTLEPQTSRVYIASTNAGLSFYLPWIQGRNHFSRNYALWMLPGLLTSQLMPDKQVAATKQLDDTLSTTIAEIQCAAPHLLIGDITTFGRTTASGFVHYDIKPMDILLSNGAFERWVSSNYIIAKSAHAGVTLWRAKDPNGPRPVGC
jgi:hypothetical protein